MRTLHWASVMSCWNTLGDRPVPPTWARPPPPPAVLFWPLARQLQLLQLLALAPLPLPMRAALNDDESYDEADETPSLGAGKCPATRELCCRDWGVGELCCNRAGTFAGEVPANAEPLPCTSWPTGRNRGRPRYCPPRDRACPSSIDGPPERLPLAPPTPPIAACLGAPPIRTASQPSRPSYRRSGHTPQG